MGLPYQRKHTTPETAFVQIWRVHKEGKITFEFAILYRDFKLKELTGDVLFPVTDVETAYKLHP